jgi:Flp pilus assembly protein TadG
MDARPKYGCCSGFSKSHSGTAAVEFAIVAPLFLFFLMGMIAYGIYFGAAHSVQQLAADAARTAIAGLSPTERQALAQNFITLNAGGYVFIEADKLAVQVADNPIDAQQFVVSVQYDAANLPIWGLLANLPLPGKTIARSSTIRIGGI